MNRDEALKILRLNADHDAHAVEQSYWSLVRRAQSRDDEHVAQLEIDRLNAAYAVLAPAPEPQASTAAKPRLRSPASAQVPHRARPAHRAPAEGIPEVAIAWFSAEVARVVARWRGRALEAGALFVAVIALAVVALAAGAPFAAVLVCTAIAAAVVWAPWRGTGDDTAQEP